MSQEELADRACLHRNYVGLLERGERNPSAKTLVALATALSIAPADFWMKFDLDTMTLAGQGGRAGA